MRQIEKQVMLQKVDQHWREHLAAMDYLRQGIHLRGYAQKDYRFEYKREAFELFAAMLDRIKFETASLMATLDVRTQEEIEREEEERRAAADARAAGAARGGRLAAATRAASRRQPRPTRPGRRRALRQARRTARATHFVRDERKVGRNEPCPCGSGKKFKHCHGVLSSGARASARQRIRVVAAALYDAQGRVLIAERPAGKHMAGRWEFPGGKVDPPESERAALERELREELGIEVESAQPLMRLAHAYADRDVELSLWVVGALPRRAAAARRPALKWVRWQRLGDEDILEADRPFIAALQARAAS